MNEEKHLDNPQKGKKRETKQNLKKEQKWHKKR